MKAACAAGGAIVTTIELLAIVLVKASCVGGGAIVGPTHRLIELVSTEKWERHQGRRKLIRTPLTQSTI